MDTRLEVQLLGKKWKTPIAAAASPLTRNGDALNEMAAIDGVGAVVGKTAYYTSRDTPRPTMVKVPGGLVNFDWSGSGIDKWESYLLELQKNDTPVFMSYAESDPKKFLEMGKRLEKAGAEALETPVRSDLSPEEWKEKVAALKNEVSVPVIGKIGSNLPRLEEYCRALEEGGADALSGINTIGPHLPLDNEKEEPFLGNSLGHGYFSGFALKGLALATTARVYRSVDIPYIAGGGIRTSGDIIDFLRYGASAVFVATQAILRGRDIFDKLARDLSGKIESRGKDSVEELKGEAHASIRGESVWTLEIPEIDYDLCTKCGNCVTSCIYHSLEMADKGPVHTEDGANCFGCGLCISVCPTNAIYVGLNSHR